MKTLYNNVTYWICVSYVTPFTGMAGMSLHWNAGYDYALWQSHFPQIATFLAPYNFNESSGNVKGWMPFYDYDEKHYESGDPKPGIVDLFYLRSPDEKRAVGVLANRTYNFYTQWDVAKCGAFVWSGDDEDGDSIPDIQEDFELTSDNLSWNNYAYSSSHTAYYINESLQVDVKSKKTYIVTYFNAQTLQVVGSEEKYNATGKLNLNFPFITGTDSRPIVLFTVEPKNKDKNTEQYLDSVNKKLDAIAHELQMNTINENAIKEARIFPNPAGEYLNIELPENVSNCRIELLSSTGIFMKSVVFSNISYSLSLEGIDPGLFILRLVYDQKIETFKLIVE